MEASALLLMLDTLLGQIEQQLERMPGDAIEDLALAGVQAGRAVALHVRLAQRLAALGPRRAPERITAETVRAILAARHLWSEHFAPDIADAGWTLLLTLYRARLEGRAFSVTKLAAEAAVPHTTALRWLNRLQRDRLVSREPDPDDERAALIDLSDGGAARIEEYLKAALRMAPVIV